MLLTSGDAANPALRTVRQDDDAVVPKDLWNRGAIVREVEFVGVLQMLVGGLESLSSMKRRGIPFTKPMRSALFLPCQAVGERSFHLAGIRGVGSVGWHRSGQNQAQAVVPGSITGKTCYCMSCLNVSIDSRISAIHCE
jgi:hypothetical protein